MDTTDDEEHYVTKYPTKTDKPPPIASAPIDTALPSPIYEVPVVVTRAQVEIVTISPIEKEKTPFKTVTTTVFPIDKLPASLSSISVLMKASPVKTDYIIPRVDIDGRDLSNDICSGYPYNILVTKCAE